jgi:hypothetical protein
MKIIIVVICLLSCLSISKADEIDEAGWLYRAEQAERVANAEWEAKRAAQATVEEQRQEIAALHQELEACQSDKNNVPSSVHAN